MERGRLPDEKPAFAAAALYAIIREVTNPIFGNQRRMEVAMERVEYESIRSELKTGDIVLFSGKGGVSTAIKWFTTSRWSHVGMVLRLPAYNMILLWESTTLSKIKDLQTGTARKGVQVVPLSTRLKTYDGDVGLRRLQVPDEAALNYAALHEFRAEVRGAPYEESEIELVKSAYDGPFGGNVEDLSSLFCSEMVAEGYQRMGLLPGRPASNEYTPKDFSSDGRLPLQLQATLAPEQELVAG
jgi:hypothetical protein